ncbi:MAG: ABC transporter ATP-binding protein [Steroidobacteraceae bacterium]
MLKLASLSVGYPGLRGTVLGNVSLTATPGSFVCVLGRNGAGKSTLMRTIAGLQAPLGGSAHLDDVDIHRLAGPERARRIAVVLTERQNSPGLTVDDVVGMGRQPFTGWRGNLSVEDRHIAAQSLAAVDAARFQGRLFDDLSDGERQRVMIARALAQAPDLMVLDEITAFLDLMGRVEVMSLLRSRARQRGTIVILSSHDLELSLQFADVVWLLGGAAALEAGTADELIMSGAVGRAFDTAAVRFSAVHRRFELSD